MTIYPANTEKFTIWYTMSIPDGNTCSGIKIINGEMTPAGLLDPTQFWVFSTNFIQSTGTTTGSITHYSLVSTQLKETVMEIVGDT